MMFLMCFSIVFRVLSQILNFLGWFKSIVIKLSE